MVNDEHGQGSMATHDAIYAELLDVSRRIGGIEEAVKVVPEQEKRLRRVEITLLTMAVSLSAAGVKVAWPQVTEILSAVALGLF